MCLSCTYLVLGVEMSESLKGHIYWDVLVCMDEALTQDVSVLQRQPAPSLGCCLWECNKPVTEPLERSYSSLREVHAPFRGARHHCIATP